MDRLMPDRAAMLASVPAGAPPGGVVCPDDLPDGLVVADHAGRIVVFNQAAARLTGIAAHDAIGQDIRAVLPLRDTEGRSWWACTDPYRGLSIRTRHPERPLLMPDGTEFLVSMGYVRVPRAKPGMSWPRPGPAGRGAADRGQLAQRAAAGPAGAQPGRPGLHRGP